MSNPDRWVCVYLDNGQIRRECPTDVITAQGQAKRHEKAGRKAAAIKHELFLQGQVNF